MAHVPIATVTTLAQMIDEIRERTNTVSEEESELFRTPLINLCHDAVLQVRDAIDPETMRRFYFTEPSPVTETSNLIDISALDLASVKPTELQVFDSLAGVASMMTFEELFDLETINSPAMMANFFAAYVSNIGGKMQIRTFRGIGLAGPGTVTLSYIRNPVKATAVADKIDLPESMIRQAIELVVKWVPERLKGA